MNGGNSELLPIHALYQLIREQLFKQEGDYYAHIENDGCSLTLCSFACFDCSAGLPSSCSTSPSSPLEGGGTSESSVGQHSRQRSDYPAFG